MELRFRGLNERLAEADVKLCDNVAEVGVKLVIPDENLKGIGIR